MQFAIDLPPFGPFSDPNLVAQLAEVAEEAGWNGFFLWDHINYKLEGSPEPVAIADPWIMLAAIALRTTRIKLGPMVTPIAAPSPLEGGTRNGYARPPLWRASGPGCWFVE